ncbi:sulfatase family protein [Ruania alba]|uniref:Arylsulfatase A n=1 Tax=Ruania alba TaxID=648782 RepID=A0A1H5K954_9MICO|nr:sulfatase-like hydrolase/transferase [Ruania alba]SEE61366.1 Arylsulfatase A [Ruania alba]
MTATEQPDILLILADQLPAAALGSYGCTVPSVTPHLDALAERGVRFDRHYTPVPICGPSRVALLTGCSPAVTGGVANDSPRHPDVRYAPQDLREAGYTTTGIGKFHLVPHSEYPPDDLDEFGFDHVEITEDTKHGPWMDWIAQEHPERVDEAFATTWPAPYLSAMPPDGRDERDRWEQAQQRHLAPLAAEPHRPIVHPSPLPAELHQSTWIADRTIHHMQERDPDRPMFLYASFVDPHDPYDPPEPWWSFVDPDDVPSPVPQEWDRHNAPWQYPAFQDTKFGLDTFDEGTWATLRAAYFGSLAFVDEQIGRILTALRDSGRERDTLVLVTTDHGDLLGDHGLLMKGPWHYDSCIRVPMIAAGAGTEVGASFDGLTSHLDLRPTLLSAAGIDAGPSEGVRLPRSTTELSDHQGHDHLVVETNTSYVAPAGDQVRTLLSADGWRLTVFPDQEYGELFHLVDDPQEQTNRYDEPGCLQRRLQMTEELVAAMAAPSMAQYRPGTRPPATAPQTATRASAGTDRTVAS